ncbi:universal stress protein [Streptomyces xanthophaeus]|uniref:universal stress protein n=1 Tax=Streptomyces xanthophaeus TaxID=67385 RepID=UPI00342AE96F
MPRRGRRKAPRGPRRGLRRRAARCHPRGLTVRGSPGAALVDVARGPDDLLVVGTGSRAPLRRLLRPSVARYCMSHAACPVLAVPPSPLQAQLESVHRRNVWRIPLDPRELTP